MDWFVRIVKWLGIILGVVRKSKQLIDEASEDDCENEKKKRKDDKK